MMFAVIDGLGHGRAAAAASDIAIATLERHVGDPLIEVLRHCHESLRGTRGVAMSLAAFNTEDAMLTWIGVGNVEGALLHRDPGLPCDKLLLRNGVVGSHLPTLRAEKLPVQTGDILTMVTDGVAAEHPLRVAMDAHIESMADGILASACKGTDDALVLVARYRGSQS
jgi:serine/threonine protein phosphatase PrpC